MIVIAWSKVVMDGVVTVVIIVITARKVTIVAARVATITRVALVKTVSLVAWIITT